MRSRLPPLLLVLAAAGCGRHLAEDSPFLHADSDSRFRKIDGLDLVAHSAAEPVSPEDAPQTTPESILDRGTDADSVEMKLAEVRRAVLANNLELKVQVLDPDIADTVTREERARFESTFFAGLDVSESESAGTPSAAASEVTSGALEPGVRIPLRNGGTATVSLPFAATETRTAGLPEGDLWDAGVRFSYSQPLLRGAGKAVNTAPIQVARFENRRVEARTKLTAIRVIANAEKAYWDLYAATREVEIRHDQFRWATEQLESARKLAAGGAVPEIEVVRAQAGVARRLEAIILAETARRRAETRLKRFLNRPDLPLESPAILTPKTNPAPRGLRLDPYSLAERALAHRMDMLELEVQLVIDGIAIDVARNDTLPLFALDFSYTFRGADPSLGDALEQLFHGNFADGRAGATLEIPLGNAAARARLRRAVLRRARTLASKQRRALAIRQEVHDALDQLTQDWQRVLAARRETILAGRNYEAEKRQFQAGVRTSTEVLEAVAFLADARSREIRALADYEISMIDLAFATGTVLGHASIDWRSYTSRGR